MKTILEYLQSINEPINASCNGNHKCGKCKIRLLENIEATKIEKQLLTKEELSSNIRLACMHNYDKDIQYNLIVDNMNILSEMTISNIIGSEDGTGIIMDIGTTTVVIKWINLLTGEVEDTVSFKNPQTIYGSDVITRIKYDNEHPHVLNKILNDKVLECLKKHSNTSIKKMIVCGNTTMTHLFLDYPVQSLGQVPFTIPHQESIKIDSTQLWKSLSSFTIYTLPHIDAFVGGDIVSGIYSLDMQNSDNNQMLVDLGTNGEIVVGNKDRIITTSSAAGPAFEGVGITFGSGSIDGAITKVKINDGIVSYETINNQKAKSICGSGLLSIVAELKRHNIIDELGRFNDDRDKYYLCNDIYISERDLQNIMLAKAAIQSGIRILIEEVDDLEVIYLSGGFGAYVNIDDLYTLNIIPSSFDGKVINIKNSAISGIYKVMMNHDVNELNKIIKISNNIDLCTHIKFNDYLIDSLYL